MKSAAAIRMKLRQLLTSSKHEQGSNGRSSGLDEKDSLLNCSRSRCCCLEPEVTQARLEITNKQLMDLDSSSSKSFPRRQFKDDDIVKTNKYRSSASYLAKLFELISSKLVIIPKKLTHHHHQSSILIIILINLISIDLIQTATEPESFKNINTANYENDDQHKQDTRWLFNHKETLWPRVRHKRMASTNEVPTPTTKHPSLQPSFTEPIGNHTVPVGRDVQLWCKTTNLGQFRTAWLRVEDKQILSIHDSLITRNYRIGVIVNEASSVLTIKNVQNSDKGGYMCQINSIPMKYAVGYLDVHSPPTFERENGPESSSSSDNNQDQDNNSSQTGSSSSIVVTQEGANASLSCKARAYPEATINWRREDNEPIEAQQTSETPPNQLSKLQFQQVSRLHSGAYLCIASNGVPPAASKRQVLDVQFAPVIRVPQTEVGVQIMSNTNDLGAAAAIDNKQHQQATWGRAQGSGLVLAAGPQAQLSCFVELNPSGSFYWVKLAGQPMGRDAEPDAQLLESEQLNNSDKYEIVILDEPPAASSVAGTNERKIEMRLNIRSPNKQDLGYYRCVARNSMGSQSGNIKLYESSSASFAFKDLFRSSSSSSGDLVDTTSSQQQQTNKPSRSRASSVQIRSNSRTAASSSSSASSSASSSIRTGNELLSFDWLLLLMIVITTVYIKTISLGCSDREKM